MALSTKKEGNVVTQLASATELPRMVRVRQKLDHSHIEPEEIPALVQRELEPMRSRIRTGMRVAITCGSRGVANIAIITRAIVDFIDATKADLIAEGISANSTAFLEENKE